MACVVVCTLIPHSFATRLIPWRCNEVETHGSRLAGWCASDRWLAHVRFRRRRPRCHMHRRQTLQCLQELQVLRALCEAWWQMWSLFAQVTTEGKRATELTIRNRARSSSLSRIDQSWDYSGINASVSVGSGSRDSHFVGTRCFSSSNQFCTTMICAGAAASVDAPPLIIRNR